MKTFIKEIYESYKTDGVPHTLALEYTISDIYERLVSEGLMNEDLRKWFGKGGQVELLQVVVGIDTEVTVRS